MRRAIAILATSAAALLLAACGDNSPDDSSAALADKPAKEIVSRVATALRAAEGMHVTGTETDDDGTTRVTADIDAQGDMSVDADTGRQRLAFRLVGDSAFIKANASFWEDAADPQSGRLLADRWVHSPGVLTKALAEDFEQLRPRGLAECLVKGLGTVEVRGTERLEDREVVVIEDKGDKPGAQPGLLYVAATGPPLLLRIKATGPRRPGPALKVCGNDMDNTTTASDFRLSDFDKPVTARAPADAITIPGADGETAPTA